MKLLYSFEVGNGARLIRIRCCIRFFLSVVVFVFLQTLTCSSLGDHELIIHCICMASHNFGKSIIATLSYK